jgi:RNase adaptor protein for sRNA GlmZ degradation
MKKLKIDIYSFSYKKSGIPKDPSEHGGGFVFDCRVLPNPGREDQYKKLSGLDKPVKDYLNSIKEVDLFFQNVIFIAKLSVDNYLERNFDHLMFSFGCTGGQHRSVYGAELLTKYLRENYSMEVRVKHVERETWVR